MQRGDEPRVSCPVIEQLQTVAPTVRLLGAAPQAPSRVETFLTAAYEEYAGRLRAFAMAAVRDGSAADDIVQEALLRLVTEVRAGREPNNVGGWLYRVAANLIVSRGRRRSVADRMRMLLVRRDAAPSPEDEVIGHERDRTLALALSKVAPDARVALLLAARGMGAAEIGLVIHRSPGATRTYICRARVRLRDELARLGMEHPR